MIAKTFQEYLILDPLANSVYKGLNRSARDNMALKWRNLYSTPFGRKSTRAKIKEAEAAVKELRRQSKIPVPQISI